MSKRKNPNYIFTVDKDGAPIQVATNRKALRVMRKQKIPLRSLGLQPKVGPWGTNNER